MSSLSNCSEESDLSDISVNPKSSYRVSVCLRRCFTDIRSRCYILISRKQRVRWLEHRLRKLFSLHGSFHLCSNGHLLPSSEPLALLNPDDRVEVVPHEAGEETINGRCKLNKIYKVYCGEDTLDTSNAIQSLVTNEQMESCKSSKVQKKDMHHLKDHKTNESKMYSEKDCFQIASNENNTVIATTEQEYEDVDMEDGSQRSESIRDGGALEKEKRRALALLDERLADFALASSAESSLPAGPAALSIAAEPVNPESVESAKVTAPAELTETAEPSEAAAISVPAEPAEPAEISVQVEPPQPAESSVPAEISIFRNTAGHSMPVKTVPRRRRLRRRRAPRDQRSATPISPFTHVPELIDNRSRSPSCIGKSDDSTLSEHLVTHSPASYNSISPSYWPATLIESGLLGANSPQTSFTFAPPTTSATAPSDADRTLSCSPALSGTAVTRNNANCPRKPRLVQSMLEIKNSHIIFPV